MNKAYDISPVFSGGTTNSLISNQEITYNEVGISYNEDGYVYGGLYGSSDGLQPVMTIGYGQDSAEVTPVFRSGLSMGLLLAITYTNL